MTQPNTIIYIQYHKNYCKEKKIFTVDKKLFNSFLLFSVYLKVFDVCYLIFCTITVEGLLNNDNNVISNYNPCCNLPCEHRGVCTPVSCVQYECDCPDGYYGKNCEKSSFSKWLMDKISLDEMKKQELVSTRKFLWGLVNNIPFLHNAALRYFYLSGSESGGFGGHIWPYDLPYTTLNVYYNQSYSTRGLPPVPQECPTPLGVKGPEILPEIEEIFELLFRRREFKPCPFGTNLMFLTFAQYLTYHFFKMDLDEVYPFGQQGFDLTRIYGPEKTTLRALRSFVDGKLKSKIINGEEYPPYLDDAPEVAMYYPEDSSEPPVFPKWALENKMFSVTPLMFTMATIWLREHNRICDLLTKEHSDWNDERVYQTARWIILGELLTITAGEYFQHLVQYQLKLRYKPHLLHNTPIPTSQQMQYEFGLLFQWLHAMPDTISIGSQNYDVKNLTYSNNRIVFEHGMDAVIDSMSRTPAGEISYRNCGKAFEDMIKKIIKEGRKTRLHSLNDYRRFYNLKPYESFMELVGNEEIADILENLYGDIDAVEFVVGVLVEKHQKSAIPPTMVFLTGTVALRKILNNPIGSSALWRSSTFGGKTGFDIVQKATLRKLFCLNLKGNCKNNVWVSFKTPWEVTVSSKKINAALCRKK